MKPGEVNRFFASRGVKARVLDPAIRRRRDATALPKPGSGPTGEALTTGIRRDIEQRAKVGGGISRRHTLLLLAHIDRLGELLNEALTLGQEWTDEEWSTFTDAAIPLLDGWTVRAAVPA